MSYIEILNSFWKWRQFNALSHSAADLFYALIDLINAAQWKDSVTIPNSRLMGKIDITEKTFFNARNALIQNRLIEYKNGKKGQAGTYSLNLTTIKNYSTNYSQSYSHKGSNKGSNTGGNLAVMGATYYKDKDIEKDKEVDEDYTIPPLPPEGKLKAAKKFDPNTMIRDFTDDVELQEALGDFVAMRKGMKKPLTTERAFKGVLKRLSELSTNPAEQVELVNTAVERNWLTIYRPKETNENTRGGDNLTPVQRMQQETLRRVLSENV